MFDMLNLLLRIKVNLFLNSIKEINTWIKYFSYLGILLVFKELISSNNFINDLFEQKIHPDNTFYMDVFIIVFFSISIINIFTLFFFNSDLQEKFALMRFPLSLKKIIFLELFSINISFISFIFFIIYLSIFFFFKSFNLNDFLLFFLNVTLLNFLIINLYYLLKNSLNIFFISLKKRVIFTLFLLSFIYVAIRLSYLIPLSPDVFSHISSCLNYYPTSVLHNFLINDFPNNFAFTFFYFISLNFLIFLINFILIKKNKKQVKVSLNNVKKNKSSVFNFISNPLLKKNLLYFVRSPKMTINFILSIVFFLFIVFPVFQSDFISSKEISILIMMFLLVQVSYLAIYGGNYFGQEYSGIVNYFIFPISFKMVILSKILLPLLFVLIFFLLSSIVLIILKITFWYYVLYSTISLFQFFTLNIVFSICSFYFPRNISFTQVNGLNTSFTVLVVTIIILFIHLTFLIFVLSYLAFYLQAIVVFLLLTSVYIIIRYRMKILKHLEKIYHYKKKVIIKECIKKH